MGRPEGPSCYCAVNNILRNFLDKLGSAYTHVVIDNEAGMEHLSRRTTNNIDLLLIVSEATAIGALTAQRIYELTQKLPIAVKRIGIIWNKSQTADQLENVETLGCVPYDEKILDAAMQGKTIFDIETDSVAFSALNQIIESELNLKIT